MVKSDAMAFVLIRVGKVSQAVSQAGRWPLRTKLYNHRPFYGFFNFDIDQLGKIRRHYWKEHLKAKFEGIL